MAESTTLMPVKLVRRRAPRTKPAASKKTHALPQLGAGTDRTLCGRPVAAGVTLDEGNPSCKRCVRAIEQRIAAGVDVSMVSGDGIVTLNGIELVFQEDA